MQVATTTEAMCMTVLFYGITIIQQSIAKPEMTWITATTPIAVMEHIQTIWNAATMPYFKNDSRNTLGRSVPIKRQANFTIATFCARFHPWPATIRAKLFMSTLLDIVPNTTKKVLAGGVGLHSNLLAGWSYEERGTAAGVGSPAHTGHEAVCCRQVYEYII
jgi:hypothetical protein